MVLLRPRASVAVKEKRLAALLEGRQPADDPRLRAAVEDAGLLGSLQLAGIDVAWEDVQAQRRGAPAAAPVAALRRAFTAVAPETAFSLSALRAWHAAVVDAPSVWRAAPRARPSGPPTAPPEFIPARLELLASWLAADSSRELGPAQAGALTLARVVEIAPFDDGNGRVARLAAAHAMVRAGSRAPILVGGDRPRLESALQAAFQLHTEPLVSLLEEAAERPLDVMLQTLAGRA
jgi:hypothetical protein